MELSISAAICRSIRFLAEEVGATTTERAKMMGLIVVAAFGATGGVGQKVDGVFATLDQGFSGASGS